MLSKSYQFTLRELLAIPAMMIAGVGSIWGIDDFAARIIGFERFSTWTISFVRLPLFANLHEWQIPVLFAFLDVPGILVLALVTFGLGSISHRFATLSFACLLVCHPVADCFQNGVAFYVTNRNWLSASLLIIPVVSYLVGRIGARRWQFKNSANWVAAAIAIFLTVMCCYGYYLHIVREQ